MTKVNREDISDGLTWGDAIGRAIAMAICTLIGVGLAEAFIALLHVADPPSALHTLTVLWPTVVTMGWLVTVFKWMSPVFNRYGLDFLFHLILAAPAVATLILG
jgi:hypothetical protein